MAQNPTEISWQSPEYVYYPKSTRWYISMGVIALVVLGYAIWTRDFIMFATLGCLFVAAYFFTKREPREITVSLSGKGVTINRVLYPYQQMKAFWIHYAPPDIKTVNFETVNYVNRDISIQLEDQNPNSIRDFLLQYLPEDLDREEPYTEKLLRRLKF